MPAIPQVEQKITLERAAAALRAAGYAAGVEHIPFDDGFLSIAGPFVSIYLPDDSPRTVHALHAVAYLTGLQVLQGPLGLWFLVH